MIDEVVIKGIDVKITWTSGKTDTWYIIERPYCLQLGRTRDTALYTMQMDSTVSELLWKSTSSDVVVSWLKKEELPELEIKLERVPAPSRNIYKNTPYNN